MAGTVLYKAPWSQTLTAITVGTCVLLIGVALLFVGLAIREQQILIWWAILPLGILIVTAFFMVRSYQIDGDQLRIERLGWQTTIALNDLASATYDPTAMDGSLRLWGNGGLFAFSGKFWNKKLGRYDVYATALRLAVVLKFSDKTVVVTPEKPEQFAAQIMDLAR